MASNGKIKTLACKCGQHPRFVAEQNGNHMSMFWLKCDKCGRRTGTYATKREAAECWNECAD